MGPGDRFCLGLFGAALAFSSPAAFAYTPTLTSSGVPVRWKGQPRLDLAGNPRNAVGISDSGYYRAVTRSLQRWNAASAGKAEFGYWQGTDPGVYLTTSAFEGLSAIYFASNAKQDPHLSSNVLGLTQVWYDTSTGEILEADIVLNDRDFRFTTNAQDTSGYGSGSISYGTRNTVYIENVITHELGHAFGLSHSGALQSTMLFMESPEQAHLGCDETVGINALYPGWDGLGRGALSGTILSEAGAPVFGAHVLAISRLRGTVLASALSDRSGRYRIEALEPGSYFLMVEPFYAGGNTLPSYYSSINGNVCSSGRTFSRTVLSEASGIGLRAIDVIPGGTAAAPTVTVRCNYDSGAAVPGSSGASDPATAPVIFDGAGGGGGFGAADRFSSSRVNTYRLRAVGGSLRIHVLSYGLYSPMKPSLALLDSRGEAVPARVSDTVYEGDSGYVNYDAALSADGLAQGEYLLRVTGTYLESSYYPAGPVALDRVPFLMITGSVNGGEPSQPAYLPSNARCRMDESFPDYVSPGGLPPRHDQDGDGIGFCGTVSKAGATPGSKGGGASPQAIAGWFLPYLGIGLIARALRRRKSWGASGRIPS